MNFLDMVWKNEAIFKSIKRLHLEVLKKEKKLKRVFYFCNYDEKCSYLLSIQEEW